MKMLPHQTILKVAQFANSQIIKRFVQFLRTLMEGVSGTRDGRSIEVGSGTRHGSSGRPVACASSEPARPSCSP